MTARTEQSDAAKEHPVATLAAALAGLDVEVVVTVRAADRAELGPVPDGVRLVEELPLQLLFPTCAVAVNHGGAGTVLTAVYYGVPQVVVPRNQALVINAERIAASGAGASFPAHEIDPEAIVAAVASMLSDDTWRKAAQAVREENLAQPTPAEVRRTIEELAWS
jgi:UDP:flavonoid glycosyltransferase YjiC (YdhE family)